MAHHLTGPHDGGPFYFCAPWRTREAPQAPSEVPWCTRESKPLPIRSTKKVDKIRCPDCNRLLMPQTTDIESGYGDFWLSIPPHKRASVETIKQKAHKRRKNKRTRHFSRGK